MKVKIISGISGAGKSSLWKEQPWSSFTSVHSADDFFYDQDGKYNFDPSKLGQAHGACLRSFIHGCRAGWRAKESGGNIEATTTPIIEVVDNTNLSVEEIAPYYAVAQAYGYEVELITLHIDVYTAAERNKHGVSLRAIENMYKKLQARQLPRFWELTQSNYRWNGKGWDKL